MFISKQVFVQRTFSIRSWNKKKRSKHKAKVSNNKKRIANNRTLCVLFFKKILKIALTHSSRKKWLKYRGKNSLQYKIILPNLKIKSAVFLLKDAIKVYGSQTLIIFTGSTKQLWKSWLVYLNTFSMNRVNRFKGRIQQLKNWH